MPELPSIITNLSGASNISENEIDLIQKHLEFISIKKGEHFLEAGKICNRLGILADGLLFANFETEKGKLNVSRFFYHPRNLIVTSFESFKNQTHANETITAIEPSTLCFFTHENLKHLSQQIPVIDKVILNFAEDSYILALQRIHDLQVLNAKERAQKFFMNNRELFNRVNKSHIASYLRIHRNDLTKYIAEADL